MKINRTLVLAFGLSVLMACSDTEKSQAVSSLQKKLVATGDLISTESITVSPPSVSRMWQYKIQYLASENSSVNEGDVVVRFDPQQLRNELMSKQSELAAALKEKEQKQLQQAQMQQDLTLALAEAKMNYEKEKRKAEIVDAGRSGIEKEKQDKSHQIASLRYQQAKQKLKDNSELNQVTSVVTESTITRLTSEVEQIQTEIEKLNVRAKKSGIVMYIADHKGEKVAVGDTLWQGQRVLTIPSPDKIAIKAEFEEPDTTKVTVNSKVKVTLDAYPEIPFVGAITSLGQAYKAKSQQNPKIVFEAYIALDKVDSSLMRPGMKAKIELLGEQSAQESSHG